MMFGEILRFSRASATMASGSSSRKGDIWMDTQPSLPPD
jgi:hypothetical protein